MAPCVAVFLLLFLLIIIGVCMINVTNCFFYVCFFNGLFLKLKYVLLPRATSIMSFATAANTDHTVLPDADFSAAEDEDDDNDIGSIPAPTYTRRASHHRSSLSQHHDADDEGNNCSIHLYLSSIDFYLFCTLQ